MNTDIVCKNDSEEQSILNALYHDSTIIPD